MIKPPPYRRAQESPLAFPGNKIPRGAYAGVGRFLGFLFRRYRLGTRKWGTVSVWTPPPTSAGPDKLSLVYQLANRPSRGQGSPLNCPDNLGLSLALARSFQELQNRFRSSHRVGLSILVPATSRIPT